MRLGLSDLHVPLKIPIFPLFLIDAHYSALPGESQGLQSRQVLTPGSTGRGERL